MHNIIIMKKIDLYITEKLKLNKNISTELSEDAKSLVELYSNYSQAQPYIKQWFINNDVNEFIIYITRENLDFISKNVHHYKKFKLKESKIDTVQFSKILQLCDKYFGKGEEIFNKYEIYYENPDTINSIEIHGTDKILLITTYNYEMLILKN